MRHPALVAAILTLAGCNRTVGDVVLSFLTSPNIDEKPLPTDEEAAGDLTIEVRVEGPGISVARGSTRYVPGHTRLTVPGVDVGPDRIITVSAENALGEDTARARSLPFDMSGDDEGLALYLALVGSSSEAHTRMTSPRFRHTATPLPDGRILLAGGGRAVVQETDEGDRVVSSLVVPADPVPYAEIFDPTSGSVETVIPDCRPTAPDRSLCLVCRRMGQVAGVDVDGAPLLASGEPSCPHPVERFASGRFENAGELDTSVAEAAAFETPRGVVVAGGLDLTTGEPLEQATRLTGTEQFPIADGLQVARYGAAGAPLPDGGGIVVGGFVSVSPGGSPSECVCADPPCELAHPDALDCRARGEVTGSIERYDPRTETFEEVGTLAEPRAFATATALPDGRVVILGGLGPNRGIGGQNLPTTTIEVFDPESGVSCPNGNLGIELWMHAAAAAGSTPDDNRVIVVGGYQGTIAFGVLSKGIQVIRLGSFCGGDTQDEICCNGGVRGEFLADADGLRFPRAGHSLTRMANGAFLIAGGVTPDGVTDVLDVFWLE